MFCRTFIDPSVLQPTQLDNTSTSFQSDGQKHFSTSCDELYDSQIVIKYDLYQLMPRLTNAELETAQAFYQVYENGILEDNFSSAI